MRNDPRTEAAAAAAPPVDEFVADSILDDGVLDDSVLASLLELGDPEFLAELVDDFVSSTGPYLETLGSALDSADTDTVHRTAHTMKSSAANMGATRFSELCRDIEAAGRRGDLDGVDALYAELRSQFGDVARALRAAVADCQD